MEYAIHWFRRDLRIEDNTALHNALNSGYPVKCIFIFDQNILEQLPKKDKRISLIHQKLRELKKEIQKYHSDIWVYYGKPIEVWQQLASDQNLKKVFTNRDYEPYAQQRDKKVYEFLKEKNITFKGYKDHVIFEKDEIITGKRTPYTVYTPYMKSWKREFLQHQDTCLKSFEVLLNKNTLFPSDNSSFLSLKEIGFKEVTIPKIPNNLKEISISNYDKIRDIPSKNATTKLGTALRFGFVSIRKVVKFAVENNETFLNELIWREFFMQIIYHFPRVENECFRKKYESIKWRNNEEEFKLWCEGKTGFPIVDAGMRELNKTGFMHNRVRMIAGSFLVKNLLIDWRWGATYFAQKLIDFDLASNNGNWQWVAGTGTDAAPYFRIFNAHLQQKKFDPNFEYIKKWIPEFGTADYPEEMVNHKETRERCLVAYKNAINNVTY